YSSYSMVTIGMATGVEQGAFWIEPLDELIARRIVQRVVPTEEYIPFVIAYDDDEMVTKFPMAVKVTVPFGYDPEYFGVYYTPNQKSIMAKLDGEFTDEEKTEYQFIVYEPGAYVLIHEVKNLLVEEIVVKEEVTLAPNRNYSIKPVVLPKKAENRDVEYWSSDERIATVSERGQVRTLAEGTCEIWVKAMDGSGVYSIVTITVKDPRKNKLRK
ncbi:MAG: Ig-like domain-containing protein, partial [Lachnospiraceae bacterium]|nr:Ig-like domain-containing protein [Lachnospiraceae bacterium]